MKALFRVGRILFGGFFLYSGINHFLHRRMLTGYAQSKDVPAPGVAVTGSGALLVAAGASLVTGIRPELGAAAVALFLVGASPAMHNFWAVPEGQKQNETIHFSKNLAMLGAALCLAAAHEPHD